MPFSILFSIPRFDYKTLISGTGEKWKIFLLLRRLTSTKPAFFEATIEILSFFGDNDSAIIKRAFLRINSNPTSGKGIRTGTVVRCFSIDLGTSTERLILLF